MRDEADQARYVVERVLENREAGAALKQQAVLFRASHHSGPLEVELTRRNIPFVKFGGLKFLDAAHVKDVLALLRFVENPRDRVAGFRLLQLLPGVGPATAQRVLDHMAEARRSDRGARAALPAPPRGGRRTGRLSSQRDRHFASRTSGWPAELETRAALVRAASRAHARGRATRRADLLQLEQIAGGYPSRERFLTELTLDPPDATSDQAGVPLLDEDYLILSTIHSAKGQEWKSVFVLNVVDGCIPSDLGTGTTAEIEEERRLLYVAMTRAKDDLHLIVPQRFFTHGQQRARATGTSMRRARASFPAGVLPTVRTHHLAGRRRGEPLAGRPRRPASTSAPGCAACGASPGGRPALPSAGERFGNARFGNARMRNALGAGALRAVRNGSQTFPTASVFAIGDAEAAFRPGPDPQPGTSARTSQRPA